MCIRDSPHTPRAARAAAAVRADRRPPAHAGRGREAIRGDPRANPPDRSESAAQAPPPVALQKAPRLPGVEGIHPPLPAGERVGERVEKERPEPCFLRHWKRGSHQRFKDRFVNASLRVVQDIVVPEPDDSITKALNLLGPLRVPERRLIISVRIAIDLDDQPSRQAYEVHDEVTYHMLAAELETSQPLRSQDRPYASLGRS